MDKIFISKLNETFVKISCEQNIHKELDSYFMYESPGAKWSESYKRKLWDGFTHIYSIKTHKLYAGLVRYVLSFAQERGYSVETENKIGLMNNFSVQEAKDYFTSLDLYSKGKKIEAHDHQIIGLAKAIRYKRLLVLSPTASGKSLLMYGIARWLLANECKRGLIIVPTTGLVEQLFSDFVDYRTNNTIGGWVVKDNVQRMYEKYTKEVWASLVISTWQSIYEFGTDDFFGQFDFVIGDEAHHFKSTSLKQIMTRLVNAKYRIGTTGTLDDMPVHKLVIEGHFGPHTKLTSTKELQEKKLIADLSIKSIILKHPEEECRNLRKLKEYQAERDYLINSVPRNKFLTNLAISLNGNSLLLFNNISHGKALYEMLINKAPERNIFLVYGETETEIREDIRKIVDTEKNAIIVASYGVFSTGVNIPNLHNLIFGSPSRSRIRVLQSIGRGLRLTADKTHATLFDISDDLRIGKRINYTLKQFVERLKFYKDENWKVSSYIVGL